MDTVLGVTIDPFTGKWGADQMKVSKRLRLNLPVFVSPDRRYIAWLTVVAVAYNYNIWFCSARLAFPYHSETANPYWVVCDILSDIVNVIDIMLWQPRLQFVKAGDIIVSLKASPIMLCV